MKIRTDFVTNSSSSCFCVSLSLSFDNGKKLTCGCMDSVGEEYDECANEPIEDILSCCGGIMFSKIVESRKNISELRHLLSSFVPKSEMTDLNNATELTSADLHISGCASGEESWRITMYRLLGLEDVDLSKDSVDANVSRLKKAGMEAYEEDGLKQIVIYEDMGRGGIFKQEAKELKIPYDEYDLSKTIHCSMQDSGKIKVKIYPGTSYEKGKPVLGNSLKTLGKICTVKKAEVGFNDDVKEEVIEAIKTWVGKKKYPINIEPDDDLDSIYQKLGLAFSQYDETMIFDKGETDCTKLRFPFAEFVETIKPFVYGGLFIVDSENGYNPMTIFIADWYGTDGIEIRETTDEDYEGFPW